MGVKDNQPDWNQFAQKFDMWLPQLKPVGDKMLEVFNAQPGDKILDVASGTGEPALTLARQVGDGVEIIGIDAAEGMSRVAQAKVVGAGLKNIRFVTMPVETLDFEGNYFDKILSRFGVMLFADPLLGLKEMCRVLKPGGSFTLAVWADAESMPTINWAHQALKDKLSADILPPLAKITALGEPGVIDSLLQEAGFREFNVNCQTFHYQFKSFDDYWAIVETSDIMKIQFDVLDESERMLVRDEIAKFAQRHIDDNGLCIPHNYLLITGTK